MNTKRYHFVLIKSNICKLKVKSKFHHNYFNDLEIWESTRYSANWQVFEVVFFKLLLTTFHIVGVQKLLQKNEAIMSLQRIKLFTRTVLAQGHKRKIKYLICSLLRSSVETKGGVEFRHSTCNALRIRRKVGRRVS